MYVRSYACMYEGMYVGMKLYNKVVIMTEQASLVYRCMIGWISRKSDR